jgi:hypothetical protein
LEQLSVTIRDGEQVLYRDLIAWIWTEVSADGHRRGSCAPAPLNPRLVVGHRYHLETTDGRCCDMTLTAVEKGAQGAVMLQFTVPATF